MVSEKDVLLRFILPNAGVRGAIVKLDDAWHEVQSSHTYPASVTEILGQAVSAATALSSLLKIDGSLILQTQSSGELHTLVAHATSERTVRGLARFEPGIGQGSMGQLCGEGKLVITIDSSKSERYQGLVMLEGVDMSAILETYFSQSEQLKTRLWLQANEESACALMLQELGDKSREEDDTEGWQRAVTLAETITPDELIRTAPAQMIYQLFHEESLRLFEPETLAFSCGCSIERIEDVLRSLGKDEVVSIIEEKGQIDVDCEFCNRHYSLSPEDAEKLFDDDTAGQDGGDRGDGTLH